MKKTYPPLVGTLVTLVFWPILAVLGLFLLGLFAVAYPIVVLLVLFGVLKVRAEGNTYSLE